MLAGTRPGCSTVWRRPIQQDEASVIDLADVDPLRDDAGRGMAIGARTSAAPPDRHTQAVAVVTTAAVWP